MFVRYTIPMSDYFWKKVESGEVPKMPVKGPRPGRRERLKEKARLEVVSSQSVQEHRKVAYSGFASEADFTGRDK